MTEGTQGGIVQRIGVIGIGIMGTAYAANLIRAGFEATGWDVEDSRRQALNELGGTALGSIAAVAAGADLVITALPSIDALLEAVEGDDGLAAGAQAGLIVAETSTFPLAAKQRARAYLEPHGVAMLDAPVSGTGLQAVAAEVAIYASGAPEALAAARPVFDAIGKATFDLGEFGNGSRMKFVANLLVSVHNLATAEAFVLGMKSGLEPGQILEVISAGVGTSRIFEIRGPMMVADDYPPAAKLEMFIKDIAVIGDLARELGVATPLLDASRGLYEEAVGIGLGELDAAALCRLLEDKAGYER
jgi:3-hydroxyisobutyrate dehydrogenase-like beta-hydroxyacid dehydrogenase